MAGGVEELAGDIMQQVFFVTAVFFILLTLVFAFASNDVFKDFYAKDLGLTVSALYASNGQTAISYDKLDPSNEFAYNFTSSALLIADNNKNDKGGYDWDTRKVYGFTDGILMKETVFNNPKYLVFIKSKNLIEITKSDHNFQECSSSKGALYKYSTILTIEDTENLLKKEFTYMKNRKETKVSEDKTTFEMTSKTPKLKINFKISTYQEEFPTIEVTKGFSNPNLEKITCLLKAYLEDSKLITKEVEKGQQTSRDDIITIEIKVPKNKPGLDLNTVIKKFKLVLFK